MFTRNRTPEQAYAANLPRLLLFRGFEVCNIYTVYWIIYLTQVLGLSSYEAIKFASISNVLGIFLEVPTGWLADRFGRKGSLIIASCCCMLGLSIYGAATHAGPLIVVGMALANLGWCLASGADRALAADSIFQIDPSDWIAHYQRYSGYWADVHSLAQAGGAVVAVAVVAVYDLRATIWAQVLAYGVMLVFALSIKSPPAPNNRIQPLWRLAWGMKLRRNLVSVIILSSALASLSGVSLWLVPVYYTHLNGGHLSVTAFGFVWAAYTASIFVFRRTLERPANKRFPPRVVLTALTLLGAGGLLVMGLSGSFIGLFAILAFFLIRGVGDPVAARLIIEVSEGEERATIVSLSRFVMLGFIGLFVWTTSLAGEALGLQAALIVDAAVFTVITGLALLAMATLKQS
jgi:MFS family permease